MAVMAAYGLVVIVAGRAIIEDRDDLRTACGAGHVDIMCAVQHAREQVHHRDQHSRQPAPVAQGAKAVGAADRGHCCTQVPDPPAVAWQPERCRPAIMLRVGDSISHAQNTKRPQPGLTGGLGCGRGRRPAPRWRAAAELGGEFQPLPSRAARHAGAVAARPKPSPPRSSRDGRWSGPPFPCPAGSPIRAANETRVRRRRCWGRAGP